MAKALDVSAESSTAKSETLYAIVEIYSSPYGDHTVDVITTGDEATIRAAFDSEKGSGLLRRVEESIDPERESVFQSSPTEFRVGMKHEPVSQYDELVEFKIAKLEVGV